jgi:hypothetical protein
MSRRKNPRRVKVVAALAALLVAPIMMPAPVSAKPSGEHSAQAVTPGDQSSCTYVRQHRSALLASGKHTATCVESVTDSAAIRSGQPTVTGMSRMGMQISMSAQTATAPQNAVLNECAKTKNYDKWNIVRTFGCQIKIMTAIVIDTDTGAVLGRGQYQVTAMLQTDPGTTEWGESINVQPLVGTLIGLPITYKVNVTCAPVDQCVTVATDPTVVPPVTGAAAQTSDWIYSTYPPPGSSEYFGTYMAVGFWSGPSTVGAIGLDGLDMLRCDRIYNSVAGGCIIPWYGPVLDYSTTLPDPITGKFVGEVASHIKASQGGGSPGALGGRPLHYITDAAQRAANREALCPSSMGRPAGKQCDEYPFASTAEGGDSSFFGTGMFVDSTQNGDAGTILGNFYRDNHMLALDAFWVAIDRPAGTVVQDVAGGGAGDGQIGLPPPPNSPPLKAEPALAHDTDGSSMGIYRWISSGTDFGRTTDYASGPFHLSQVGDRVASGDVDGDGLSDIVLAYQNNDGTFQFNVILGGIRSAGVWYTSGPFSLTPVAGRLVVADFNGDGKAEPALIRDNGNGTMTIWRWLSTGTSFSRTTDYVSGSFQLASVGERVATGDVDGDGKADIVMAYQKSDGTFQYNVFRSGSSSAGVWYTSGPFSLTPVAGRLVVADFNGDGKAEPALMRDNGNGTMTIWRWLSTGSSFSRTTDYVSGSFHLASVGDRVAAADVNGDRKADIVTAYQDSDGTFQYNVFLNGSSSAGVWYKSGPFSLAPVGGRIVLGNWDRN